MLPAPTSTSAMIAEGQRRLALLGPTLPLHHSEPSELDQMRQRARLVDVPIKHVLQWHEAYRVGGEPGLQPQEWQDMTADVFVGAWEQARLLGDPLHQIIPDPEAQHQQAVQLGWSDQRYHTWWRRYRLGGLLALAPGYNPQRRPRRSFHGLPPRDLGLLDEHDVRVMMERRDWLGDYADQAHVAVATWETLAPPFGTSASTLRRYHSRYQRYGLLGLAPQVRTDQGGYHALSDRMVEIIAAIRLTHRNWKPRSVYDQACEKARLLGELTPTLGQVRAICGSLPPDVVALADGRESEFRNKYRFTHPIHVERERVVWLIDNKEPLDCLVRDQRSERYRSPAGTVRPFVTHVESFHQRLLMNAIFGYDKPDQFTIAEAIRGALLTTATKPYGGIPDEIWVDNGAELISTHVRLLCRMLGIALYNGRPHYAEARGRIERLHQTFDQLFYAEQPGYLPRDPGADDRPVVAELTLDELVARFWAFVERYHHRRHSELGQTPLEAWAESVFTEQVNERLLDMLLLEAAHGKVTKRGIRYANHYYTHPDLALYEGQTLLFRSPSHYAAPEYIEVYDDHIWLFQAKAERRGDGLALTPQEVAQAQQRQRARVHERIAAAQATLDATPTVPVPTAPPPVSPRLGSSAPSTPGTPARTLPASRSPDLLDRLLIHRAASKEEKS